ncbi:MAG: 50S ribosomal protein L25 [Candidatus Hydrogenedentes bacterium]|nr:50S ribosomal protein L25 [Candidatus Hydrogenedentota bacterium]
MELQQLKAKAREAIGGSAAKRFREAGELPAVLYGGEGEALSLLVNGREFTHLVHGRGGEHAIVQIEVDGHPELNSPALLKAVQHHPVRGTILHADFLRIRLDERIATLVPVALTGQPIGVTLGGLLDHQLREVEVECLALEVPDELTIDVSGLEIGGSIHVRDLSAPDGVDILTDPERVIAAVHAPRVQEEVAAVEGEEEEGEAAEGAEPGAADESESSGKDE